ncbi:putative 3-hydroxyacyl-CoA dehydrogenase [Fusarium solani]|uniref:3-hydroxyacyl-CoA dehydrogenase n=1 Tax=Fusarium solani TaxID=169388 RepID=A0A9P9GSI3_FUSSL|nr:putative 3-hydroxyacyl-CoA dehydrogenase [Fusarium solani]KAH7244878.1 putative 3-hydroxyacyl-CoA dehydrogenase [Fusarium solani]
MPEYSSTPELFATLKDKVVVLTGGAHGVGESIVKTLYSVGAHVVFGDIDEPSCHQLAEHLAKEKPTSTGSLRFRRVDVRDYGDNLALFQDALTTHGRVDHALSIAGVTEGQNWFTPELDLESVAQPPSTAVVDINLLGALYFARIAAVYLRQGQDGGDKSLLLTGSLAAFKEQAGLFVYQPSKHGVMGLFRSTRKNLYSLHGIRVNILCPSLISSGMSSRIQHVWEGKGLPINTADEVSDYAVTLTASRSQADGSDQTGLAVYVEGGKGWEFESELERLDKQWMGAKMAQNCEAINEALGVGAGWTTDKPKI